MLFHHFLNQLYKIQYRMSNIRYARTLRRNKGYPWNNDFIYLLR